MSNLQKRIKAMEAKLKISSNDPFDILRRWICASEEKRKTIKLPDGVTAEHLEKYGLSDVHWINSEKCFFICSNTKRIHLKIKAIEEADDLEAAAHQLFPEEKSAHGGRGDYMIPVTWKSILDSMNQEHREIVLQEQEALIEGREPGAGYNLFEAAHRLLEWCSEYGTPAALPPKAAEVYLNDPDAFVGACFVECEDCAYQGPMKGNMVPENNGILQSCPLCGGRIGYHAYCNKHGKSIVHMGGVWDTIDGKTV